MKIQPEVILRDSSNVDKCPKDIAQKLNDWDEIKKLQKEINTTSRMPDKRYLAREFNRKAKEYNKVYGSLNLSKRPESNSQQVTQESPARYHVA